jgi:hypothetical protein
MPAFKKYATVADGATRKQRKSQRKNTFAFNSSAYAEERRARKKAKVEAAEKLAKEQGSGQ